MQEPRERVSRDALAAEIQGRSVSDFVVAAARDAAQRTIEDAQIMRLSLAAQETIADLLLNPPAAGPARSGPSRRTGI